METDNTGHILHIQVPDPFMELFEPTNNWRHLLFYGGRSSGKSTTVATSILTKASEQKMRVLCTREYQNSINESVHQLLRDLISKYHLTDWEVKKETICNRKTGSEIYFKGLHNNSQSIKSFEGIDLVWVEEAQSVSMESIDTLIPTVRKPGSYLIWTMNRLTESDPIWERLVNVKEPDPRTYIQKVNSDAIEDLLSDEVKFERERMRKENPELYEHVWLGEPLTSNTGSVFGKQLAQAREDGRIGSVPYDGSAPVYTAWDLGIGDSTAIWFFQMIGKEIRFIDHYENCGEDLGHYIALVNGKPYNYATHYLPHDAKHKELQSGKTRVEFFADHGIANVEVLRPTNYSIEQGDIDMVARPKFSLCWFDEEKCKRGLECLRAFHFKYNEHNKILQSKPEHDWSSHSSSAFIYALMAGAEAVAKRAVKYKTYTPKMFRK